MNKQQTERHFENLIEIFDSMLINETLYIIS